MPGSCCAYGCTNRREENGDRAFDRFPREKKEEQQELREKVDSSMQERNWSEQHVNVHYLARVSLSKHSARITFSNTLIDLALSSC